MPSLKNKTILIVSPQSWGAMFVSKHHYAAELAAYGNTVYFLNPPDSTLNERVLIKPVETNPGLFIISHRLNFPYNLKFHAIGLFHWLMQWQVKKILHIIGKPIDIVWSFDLGNLYPFRLFPADTFRIFHPVDEPLNAAAIESAKGAQVVFSVTREILDKYKHYGLPLHFINHGVSKIFLQQLSAPQREDRIRVGFSGNLLRPDIDRPVFLQIIQENPSIIFECWGSYQQKDANIGGVLDEATAGFVKSLTALPNIVLHGAVPAAQLAAGYQQMNAFLVCYDIEKDQSRGTNYHKLMEFLGAGKVIISNNVTTYNARPDLVTMSAERSGNHSLPALFREVTANLSRYNTTENILARKHFAAENTYEKQVMNIEQLINGHAFKQDTLN